MSHRIVRTTDVAPQPWRNGGGVTRELCVWPPTGDWRLRVSVADIERDGPFSAYPGVHRCFAVLKGAGVLLTIDAETHRLTPATAACAFDGAATVTCRLIDGPTRDLNFMLRGATGRMRPAEAGARFVPDTAHCGLYARRAGACSAAQQRIEVPAGALLWFDPAPGVLQFIPDTLAAASSPGNPGARAAEDTQHEGPVGWWLAATAGDQP